LFNKNQTHNKILIKIAIIAMENNSAVLGNRLPTSVRLYLLYNNRTYYSHAKGNSIS